MGSLIDLLVLCLDLDQVAVVVITELVEEEKDYFLGTS